jgi:hypothetical protein
MTYTLGAFTKEEQQSLVKIDAQIKHDELMLSKIKIVCRVCFDASFIQVANDIRNFVISSLKLTLVLTW